MARNWIDRFYFALPGGKAQETRGAAARVKFSIQV